MIDYAPSDLPPSQRPRFVLWLLASVVFLAATCGSLLFYVWWLRLS
jgi:hypothetical protein